MGRRPKQPNEQLAELLGEAGLSHKGLARRVVERGRASGLALRYDHTSVRRWLAGEQPVPPGPDLIAEVLSEVLGRRVRPPTCGMSGAEDPTGLGPEFGLSWSEGVDEVTALWRNDAERRRHLLGTGYAVAVYPAASMRWLTRPGPERSVAAGRRRIGQADVDAVRAMSTAFTDLDNKVGGG